MSPLSNWRRGCIINRSYVAGVINQCHKYVVKTSVRYGHRGAPASGVWCTSKRAAPECSWKEEVLLIDDLPILSGIIKLDQKGMDEQRSSPSKLNLKQLSVSTSARLLVEVAV